jgi:hypothetical protein
MASLAFQIPVAIILLAGGLLACFLGYRLLRLVLAIYGFVAGFIVTTMFVGQFETWAAALVTIAGGLAGTLVAILAYLVGVGLLGAAVGAVVVNVQWAAENSEPNVWLVVGVSLVGALGALALRRYVIILGTSFGGAWSALVGGLALAGNSAAVAAAAGNLQQLFPLAPARSQIEFVVAWCVLGGLALVVQLRTFRRKKRHVKTIKAKD